MIDFKKYLTKSLVVRVLGYLWTSFGKPAMDDPKTPEDESDVFDPAVAAAIDALVDLAMQEAKKKGQPVAQGDLARKIVKNFPHVSMKDALARVNRALGRK